MASALLFASGVARAEAPPAGTPLTPVVLGARIGVQSLYLEGDGTPADLRGFAFAGDAALRVGRHLSFAAVFEASLYGQRSDRVERGPTATSYATFLEARADTNPEGPLSLRIDLGTGCRWLAVPLDRGGRDHYWGFEPLHLRLGPSYRVTRAIDVAALGGLGFGWFSAHPGPGSGSCAVTGTCKDSLYNSDVQSAAHFVVDVSLALRGAI